MSAVPQGATVAGLVQFRAEATAANTGGTSDTLSLYLHGYEDDGLLTLDDANYLPPQIGVDTWTEPFFPTGSFNVDISDLNLVQRLIDEDGFLTIQTRLQWPQSVFNVESLESLTPSVFPSLRVFYTPGELLVANGDFEEGSLGPWQATGTVAVVSDPIAGTGSVARLTTSSPAQIEQILQTPADRCSIEYEYLFADDSGTLSVFLGDELLTTLTAPGGQSDFLSDELVITDESLLGQSLPLTFIFDSPLAGDIIYLDNIGAVPEPGAATVLIAGSLLLLRRRR
jgi:hypothetical protein